MSSGLSSPFSALLGGAEDVVGRNDGRLELIQVGSGVLFDAAFFVQPVDSRPQHLARDGVEGLATIPLLHVALELLQAGALHVLVLERMLHVFQQREVGRLCGASFPRRRFPS